MIKSFKNKFIRIIKNFNSLNKNQNRFYFDNNLGIQRRYYSNYSEYLNHQKAKLRIKYSEIIQSDKSYESIVYERYKNQFDFSGKSIICLAARLGGEVRAFKKLGGLAIGIDIEPGEDNKDVLYGDFHDINFPDNTFDFAFTNAIDHVYSLDKFIWEVYRVLKADGKFIVELSTESPGRYEVFDTKEINPFRNAIEKVFEIRLIEDIINKTEYIDWHGKLLIYKKKNAYDRTYIRNISQ